ncbi:MAG: integrase core domain-containing protein, partial [Pseudomonadota bacterium]
AVNLKNGLGQVEADGGKRVHGWLLTVKCFAAPTLAHRDAASGAIHTINGASMVDHARHLIAAWRDDYNHHRPHSSLDGLTPREYHKRSEEDQTLNRATL